MKTGIYLTNPYAKSKFMIEEIIKDSITSGVILRYFNPIGAHKSGLFYDSSENNLVPNLCRAGLFGGAIVIFSGYLTPDQTAIRDYVHVLDVARAHVNAINALETGIHIINLGFGEGISAKQLISTFQRVNDLKLTIEFGPRRPGDLDISFANVDVAKKILNWAPKYNLEDMCKDAWNAFST
jgi:UDP-glucose 4-epimerase